MPTDTKLEKLKTLLDTLNDGLTRQEFESAVKALVDYVKKVDVRTESELAGIKDAVERAILRIESTATETTASTTKDIQNKAEKLIDEITFAKEAFLAEAQAKLDAIKDGEDGEDADENEVVEKVLARIPPVEIREETAEAIRDRLEQLEGEERLDAKSIKNLPDYSKDIDSIRNMPHAGSVGVNLTVGGTFRGQTRDLIFTGAGVTSTLVGNKYVIVVSGGGGSGTTDVETPTGAVNGTNDTYTVVNEPKYIIVDGVSKFVTLHYTYSSGTITITDGVLPTQYIRSIYSA